MPKDTSGKAVFTAPAKRLLALDALVSDDADLPEPLRAIYVGATGNLRVLGAADDDPVTLIGVPTGATIVACVRRVLATGTTATSLVGMI